MGDVDLDYEEIDSDDQDEKLFGSEGEEMDGDSENKKKLKK
jgi:hypothetical protein